MRARALVLAALMLTPTASHARGPSPEAPPEAEPAPASTEAQVAAVPRPPDLALRVGTHEYAAYLEDTRLWVRSGEGSWTEVGLGCALTALASQKEQLYVGCADGYVLIFGIDGARASQPKLLARHPYPGPVRGFAVLDGELVVDAPAVEAAAPPPPPAVHAQADPAAAQVPTTQAPTAGAQPSASPRQPSYAEVLEARKRLRPGIALMASGFSLTGTAYLVGIFATPGASLFNAYAPYRFIPVVGSFIAMADAYATGVYATFGTLQVIGVVLGGVGAGLYTKEKKRISAGTMALRGGTGLRLRIDF